MLAGEVFIMPPPLELALSKSVFEPPLLSLPEAHVSPVERAFTLVGSGEGASGQTEAVSHCVLS